MLQPVIGLEVHIQLSTKSKLFSASHTTYGAEPNTQANILDLAIPGTLPVLNKEAVTMAIKFGQAVKGNIAHQSTFARKNYFYPDLPKGYQISQFDQPIISGGSLTIHVEQGVSKTIELTRAHLEEDAGKLLHGYIPSASAVDLNRAGIPLLEIVSEPQMTSAKEAVAYLKTLHNLVQYLEICDGNMQEGSFRCDVNISLHKPGEPLGTRAEIKNINSFRFVERAIHHEIERQTKLLESGEKVVQETRLFDATTNTTRSMRSKEDAMDYRYFPEPDLLPLVIEKTLLEDIQKTLPELPEAKRTRFMNDYKLSEYDATILVSDKALAHYFESVLHHHSAAEAKSAANWIIVELNGYLNKHNLSITESPIEAEALAGLLKRISDNTISGKIAKTVFEAMWNQEGSADDIIEKRGLKQVTDTSAIEKLAREVIDNNPEQVAQYRAGKDRLFGFFVGQVMKASKSAANPNQLNDILKKLLN